MITKEAIKAALNAYYGNDVEHGRMAAAQMEAALTAALAAIPGPAVRVKPLEWVPVVEGGRDIQSITQFGTYTISVDSSFAGGRHYLWTPSEREYDDDHHSEYGGMTSARAAAQADYEARILSAIEPPDEPSQNYNCPCAHPSQCDSSCLRPAPAMSRNDEAGFVEFVNEDVPYIVREINGPCAILRDVETRKVIGYRVYDPGCSEREVFGHSDLASENERLRAALVAAKEVVDVAAGMTSCRSDDEFVWAAQAKINAALEDRT